MIVGSGWGLVASFVFKTNARRIASWVGSIPMHSRHHAFSLERSVAVISYSRRRSSAGHAVGRALLLILVIGGEARAQRADSATVAARIPTPAAAVRSAPPPPLSPRRAFLYSLLAPGYAQSRLDRPTAGALFVLTESIALAMLRESAADLRQARMFRRDSLEYIGNDPLTGLPVLNRNSYSDELISIRRSHVEDWIAFLIANHLFAGADAYVAAHLWDLPSQIIVSRTEAGTVVAARIRW